MIAPNGDFKPTTNGERLALAKLRADEQKAFTQLWADVTDLVKKVTQK